MCFQSGLIHVSEKDFLGNFYFSKIVFDSIAQFIMEIFRTFSRWFKSGLWVNRRKEILSSLIHWETEHLIAVVYSHFLAHASASSNTTQAHNVYQDTIVFPYYIEKLNTWLLLYTIIS